MGHTLLLFLLAALSSCTVLKSAHALGKGVFDAQLSGALEQSLNQVREAIDSKNVSASLYISERCRWEAAAGVTRQDPDISVNPDTIYGFGSVTKTFVAGIVLQLAEEQKLELDDPLGEYLAPDHRIDPGITIRQILNHGSKLGGYYRSRKYQRELEANPDRVWQPEDILEYEQQPRDANPGARYYTNTNYILLGMIIEAVTGQSLEQALQDRITEPLQLDGTYLARRDFLPEQWADSSKLSPARFSSVWAAGAIAATARDIAKWSHALHSGKFLQPASLKAMRVTEPRRIGRTELPMGLGVWKLEGKNFSAWGHGGNFPPFLSAAFYIPELNLGVAYSFLRSETDGQFLFGKRLADTYLENRPQDISMCFEP